MRAKTTTNRTYLAVLVGLLSCSHTPELPSGGCFIIKQTNTGEYVTVQLAKFMDKQEEVCDHIIKAWNSDEYHTGTSARFRCACPPNY